MYQVVPTRVDTLEAAGPGALVMQHPHLLPLTSDGTMQLYSNTFTPEVPCKPIHITAVSVAVDLQPDADHALLGNVAAANWTASAPDLGSLQEAINQAGNSLSLPADGAVLCIDNLVCRIPGRIILSQCAGQGHIQNSPSDWVTVAAAGYSGRRVQGYKATGECKDSTAPDCTCMSDIPELFQGATSSLLQLRAVPIITIHLFLQPGAPQEVITALKQIVTAPLPLNMPLCVQPADTQISGQADCVDTPPSFGTICSQKCDE